GVLWLVCGVRRTGAMYPCRRAPHQWLRAGVNACCAGASACLGMRYHGRRIISRTGVAMSQASTDFVPLNIAVLTVSDTRTAENDTSGDLLAQRLGGAGHALVARTLVRDDVYQLRAVASTWIADPAIQVVLVTGGTGFAGRDVTPEALAPLFDKPIEGFGELFRQVSLAEIRTSTIQSDRKSA